MQTEIANKQKCLMIRNGVEIWLDEKRWEKLEFALKNNIGKFYDMEGRTINVADIVGIFLPIDLEEMKRRKNGQWKCSYGRWHNRGENCECHKDKIQIANEKRMKEMEEAGNISEEERINNLKKLGGFKKKLFGKDKQNEKN